MQERSGWFLFDGAKVSGPLDIEALREAEKVSDKPADLLVSRPGYNQWYPIAHISSLHAEIESVDLRDQIAAFQQEVEKSAVALERLQSKKINKVTRSNIGAAKKPGDLPKKSRRGAFSHRASTIEGQSTREFTVKTQPPVVMSFDAAKPESHNHMLLRGRLRLGQMKSPMINAFINPLLTLGISQMFWYREAYGEVYWHAANMIKSPSILRVTLFMLPFLACFPSYRLAQHVRTMESQNQYGATQPWLAFILGVFPPFAIYYLQLAVNDHWILHARSTYVSQDA